MNLENLNERIVKTKIRIKTLIKLKAPKNIISNEQKLLQNLEHRKSIFLN